jgi:hypothetical protein
MRKNACMILGLLLISSLAFAAIHMLKFTEANLGKEEKGLLEASEYKDVRIRTFPGLSGSSRSRKRLKR